ncbi:MAG: superoxide dismutase [Chitinispirillia bacterium]|jgi:Fe-Mn family superoxide dismutase
MSFDQTNSGRRYFFKKTLATSVYLSFLPHLIFAQKQKIQNLSQTSLQKLESKYIPMVRLPYSPDALQPYISEKTIRLHYYNHHRSYHTRLLQYIKQNPDYDKIPLELLLLRTKGGIFIEDTLYNIGILLWNHNLYWQSMKPKGGILPESQSELTKQIIVTYGSVNEFKKKFIQKVYDVDVGWVWLVKTNDSVEILRTLYHEAPIPSMNPILCTIDMWEHAYYIDYGRDIQKYAENYLDHLVNWEQAEQLFTGQE